jgi:hypothetical protein
MSESHHISDEDSSTIDDTDYEKQNKSLLDINNEKITVNTNNEELVVESSESLRENALPRTDTTTRGTKTSFLNQPINTDVSHHDPTKTNREEIEMQTVNNHDDDDDDDNNENDDEDDNEDEKANVHKGKKNSRKNKDDNLKSKENENSATNADGGGDDSNGGGIIASTDNNNNQSLSTEKSLHAGELYVFSEK